MISGNYIYIIMSAELFFPPLSGGHLHMVGTPATTGSLLHLAPDTALGTWTNKQVLFAFGTRKHQHLWWTSPSPRACVHISVFTLTCMYTHTSQ